MAGGRPTTYSDEMAKKVCEAIATNTCGYVHLERLYPDLPAFTTVKEWRHRHPEFMSQYLEARRLQAELMVEEIDDMVPKEIRYYVDDRGQERIDAPSAGLLIAKINNRKWQASKLAPKIYGDKKEIEQLTDENQKIKAELLELRAQLDAQNKKEY